MGAVLVVTALYAHVMGSGDQCVGGREWGWVTSQRQQ